MSSAIDTIPWLSDGSTKGWISGVDGSRNPADIQKDQLASGVNITCRGGTITPRSGFVQKLLTYESQTFATAFQRGVFQRASFYDGNGFPAILTSIGGRQFKIDLQSYVVSEITPTKPLSTTTTADFTIPAVGATVVVQVADTSQMYVTLPDIKIGTNLLVIVSIDSSTQITVQNNVSTQVGVVVTHPATVGYSTLDMNDPNKRLGWTLQAINYWLYQDNQGKCIIYDGASSVRSNPSKWQVPVGNVMAFSMGRIVVALPDRITFRAGDIIYGSSGTLANGYRDAILYFTENNYLNEGGDFAARIFGAPSGSGVITAMRPNAMPDTQLGQGPLMIGTPNMVFSVQLPFDRTTWKNLTQPLQTVVPIKGPTGQDTTIQVNADLWYRAPDSTLRSYIMAQRDFGSWGNTPQSSELGDLLTFDTEALLENGSAALFDNRLLFTVSPVDSPNGVYHRGLAVVDFNLVSNIRGKTYPAWEGVWTGLQIMQLVPATIDGKDRCFIIALNSNNRIELWEIEPTAKADNAGGNIIPITGSFELPSYTFGNHDQYKRLRYGRFIVEDLSGTLTWAVTYRTDQSPCYQPWDSGSVCATNQDCGPAPCTGPITYREQVRTPIKLHTPPDDGFDPITGNLYCCGYSFQPRVAFTGYGSFQQFRCYAKDEPEPIAREENFT